MSRASLPKPKTPKKTVLTPSPTKTASLKDKCPICLSFLSGPPKAPSRESSRESSKESSSSRSNSNSKLVSKPNIILPCFGKHEFHGDCIIEWFSHHCTCPICRTNQADTNISHPIIAEYCGNECLSCGLKTGKTHLIMKDDPPEYDVYDNYHDDEQDGFYVHLDCLKEKGGEIQISFDDDNKPIYHYIRTSESLALQVESMSIISHVIKTNCCTFRFCFPKSKGEIMSYCFNLGNNLGHYNVSKCIEDISIASTYYMDEPNPLKRLESYNEKYKLNKDKYKLIADVLTDFFSRPTSVGGRKRKT